MILHTVDGGEYWRIQAKTHHRGIGVRFRDRKSGWVVMGNGASLLTTDGGESWKRDLETEHSVQGTDFDIYLLTVKFQNHTQAWDINISGAILTTHN